MHGQGLKVHPSDVENKAHMLLDFQQKQLADLFELQEENTSQDCGDNLRQGTAVFQEICYNFKVPSSIRHTYNLPSKFMEG